MGKFYGHVPISIADGCGQRLWQIIGQLNCKPLPGPMLVPDYCVGKGQYSTFDERVHLFILCLTEMSKHWHDQ